MRIPIIPVILVLTTLFCSHVNAAITVYPIEVSVGKEGEGASKIEVLSQSSKVSFVKIIQKRIIDPGTPQEKEIAISAPDESGLIVTPMKLAITPGASRLVRLITLTPPPKETTWRVYFEEVTADEFNSNNEQMKHVKTEANVGVNVVWGALVHVLPANKNAALELDERTADLINSGTTRIPIIEIAECSSKNDCAWKRMETTVYPNLRTTVRKFVYHPGHTYRVKYRDVTNGNIKEIPLTLRGG